MRLIKVNNKTVPIFIIALAVFGITAHPALIGIARVSPLWAKGFSYQAEVENISGSKYFPAVKEALAKAEKSIKLVMFTIESPANRENSKPSQLVDALIAAKNRGVDVEVVLDQNVDFVKTFETKIKSTGAYKRLKDAGVKVYYDEPTRYTHAKTVIIDKKIVILGSTNWTGASFDNNIETSVLINSGKLAEEILDYLKTIKIDEKVDEYFETIGPAVPISWEFMEKLTLAPEMIKSQDERALDVYLYLLWRSEAKKQDKITLFYDDLAKYLGIYEGWAITDYRRQIIKVFRKLEEKYKLIKFEPMYAKEAEITLFGYEKTGDSPQKAGAASVFSLPNTYFDYGWNRELSLRAKFCYLINLACSDISDIKPGWSKSVATITAQFGDICPDVVHKGMAELRSKKLLEVQYDELSGKPYDERRPKMYKILKLYDPKALELRLKGVEEKYGNAAYAKARKYAGLVFEENNPEVIEDIILKTKEYGEKEIKRVFGEIARKSIDNPKRNYLYATRIMGRAEEAKP